MTDTSNVSFLQNIVAKKILEKTSVIKAEPSSILDLGLGSSVLADMLYKQYPNAKITSLNTAKIPQTSNNFKVIDADVAKMPFSDWSYSVIYSSLMLQEVSNFQSVFSEVKRVLAPGGYFIFSTLGPETLKEVRESWAMVDDFRHVNDFPPMQALADSLAQQGFIDVVVSTEKIVVRYDNVRTILKDLQEIGASNITTLDKYQGLMTSSKLMKFCKKYEEFKLEDGSYPVTYELVYAICWARDKAGSDAKEHLVSVDHLRNIMRRFQEGVTD